MSSSQNSLTLTETLILNLSSRRLLLQANPAPSDLSDASSATTFDANVVMILAVLLCALICALGLNSIVRCALHCSHSLDVAAPVARLAQSGHRKKAIKALPSIVYSKGMKLAGASPECAICLSEFVAGEQVRVLPKCNHGFHVRCIDRWLVSRSSCPTCRVCLFGTCQKGSSCEAGPPPHVLVPLPPESFISGYRI